MPLVKMPRRTSDRDDDDGHQAAPLNLSVSRDRTRDPASSPYRIICEWDATTENSSSTTMDAAAADEVTSTVVVMVRYILAVVRPN